MVLADDVVEEEVEEFRGRKSFKGRAEWGKRDCRNV